MVLLVCAIHLSFIANVYDFRGEIFACIGMNDQDHSWKEGYTLIPFGPCHKVMKNTEPLDVKGWTKRVKNYASEWKYPYDV